MSSVEFENIETIVLLDWYIEDFDSKFQRYRLTGDELLVRQIIDFAHQGRMILATIKEPLQEISQKLRLDLTREGITTQVLPPKGPWHNVAFLSFGTEAQELGHTYATKFILDVLSKEMAIESPPPLKFKLFYLPRLPTATTDEGHFMETVRGYTNEEKKLVGINVYPPRNYESIFEIMVHEILHVCFLGESSLDNIEAVENKVNDGERTFFTKCQGEYQSRKSKITQSIGDVINEKLSVFQEIDSALDEFGGDFRKARIIIDAFKEFFDAVLNGRVKPVSISNK